MFWAVNSGGGIPVCSRNWTSVSMNCCWGLPQLLPHDDRLRAFDLCISYRKGGKYPHASQVGCGRFFFLRRTLGCVLLTICLFFCGIFKVSEPSLPPRILLGHSQEVTSIAWCPSDFTKVCLLQNDLYCETIDEMWQHALFKMAAGFVVLGKNF